MQCDALPAIRILRLDGISRQTLFFLLTSWIKNQTLASDFRQRDFSVRVILNTKARTIVVTNIELAQIPLQVLLAGVLIRAT